MYSSKSRHIRYDAWWTQGALNHYGVLYTPERIPWSTRLSTVQKMRMTPVLPLPRIQDSLPFKDPLSCEFILIEEQKRQMRFERESPNPIWWFDYTRNERTAKGSVLNATTIPDVQIQRAQSFDEATGLTITLTMKTQARFPGYAIALWNLPIEYGANSEDIFTSGQSYTLVRNTDGETHMVLDFDLKPSAEVEVILRKPKTSRWEW